MKPTAINRNELIEFIGELRAYGFDVSTQQLLQIETLLIALASFDYESYVNDPDRLRTQLAPVICTSPEEQELFYKYFNRWMARRPKTFETSQSDPAEEFGPEIVAESVAKRRPLFRRLLWVLPLVLVAAIILFIRSRPPAVHTLSATVRDRVAGAPISGVRMSYGDKNCTTDRSGGCSIEHPAGASAAKADFTHELYSPVTIDFNASQSNTVNVAMEEAIPPPGGTGRAGSFGVTAFSEGGGLRIEEDDSGWLSRLYGPYFEVILGSVVIVPFLAFGAWAAWQLYRRRQLEKWRLKQQPNSEQLLVKRVEDKLLNDPKFRRIAQELRRHRLFVSTHLDPEQTIKATVRRGGLFTPIYGSRKKMPEYLILVDRLAFRDQQARFDDEIVGFLEREGVVIDQYHFQGNPPLCRARKGVGTLLTLEDLAARHPDHYLIIFADSKNLFNPLTGRLHVWIDLFSAWSGRALLTSEAPERFAAEALESVEFSVLPAGKAGIAALTEIIRRGIYPKYLRSESEPPLPKLIVNTGPDRWLEELSPAPATASRLLAQLKNYLGNRGYRWLCACAIYPSLLWDLTIYFGDQLISQPRRVDSHQERLLRSLVRLPWFRFGVIPDWLRLRLIRDMPRKEETQMRQLLEELLLSSLGAEPVSVPLELANDPALAEEQHFLRKFWVRLRQGLLSIRQKLLIRDFLRTEPDESPLQDYVFLTFLSGSRLAVILPQSLRRLLFRRGQVLLGVRPSMVLVCAALLALLGFTAIAYSEPDVKFVPTDYPVVIDPMDMSSFGVKYSFSPAGARLGTTVQLTVTPIDCAADNLENTRLAAPEESGIEIRSIRSTRCELMAMLTIPAWEDPGLVEFSLLRGDQLLSILGFNVGDLPTFSMTVEPRTLNVCKGKLIGDFNRQRGSEVEGFLFFKVRGRTPPGYQLFIAPNETEPAEPYGPGGLRYELTKLKAGTYTAQAILMRTQDLQGVLVAETTYRLIENCSIPCPAPSLDCPANVFAGSPLKLLAIGDTSQGQRYKWSVSVGKIIAGQGSNMISLDTVGLEGKSLTVSTELDPPDAGCTPAPQATCTIRFQPEPPSRVSVMLRFIEKGKEVRLQFPKVITLSGNSEVFVPVNIHASGTWGASVPPGEYVLEITPDGNFCNVKQVLNVSGTPQAQTFTIDLSRCR